MMIEFKKMNLMEDERTVEIEGKIVNPLGYDDKIEIEMSILQLAKVWGTDRKAVSKVENDFGSEELEDQCEETREEIKNFPKIEFWNKEIEIDDVYIRTPTEGDKILIIGEDLSGWGNEGIRIKMTKEVYDKEIGGKIRDKDLAGNDLKFVLTPVTIKLRVKRENDG